MTIKRSKSEMGVSLIEVMVSIVILLVAVTGALGYRYYAALDARRAAMRRTSARIGLLLSESWRGVKGDSTYDPITYLGSDLAITTSTGPAEPNGFTPLGSYTVVSNDGATYYATMSWKDVSTGLRALNVVVHLQPTRQIRTCRGIIGVLTDYAEEETYSSTWLYAYRAGGSHGSCGYRHIGYRYYTG